MHTCERCGIGLHPHLCEECQDSDTEQIIDDLRDQVAELERENKRLWKTIRDSKMLSEQLTTALTEQWVTP